MIENKEVLKLHRFNKRINCIYREKGFSTLPFDKEKMKIIVKVSADDLSPLFLKCFGDDGDHLLDKFYTYSGNIFEFFCCLDAENKELFVAFDW